MTPLNYSTDGLVYWSDCREVVSPGAPLFRCTSPEAPLADTITLQELARWGKMVFVGREKPEAPCSINPILQVITLFEIVFLGTSASAPSVHRGLSAQVVMHEEFRFLIDCGEGTQRQILHAGIGFKRLNHILITHGHLDHILGLAGLLSTFSRWEAIDELNIYAGRWALDRIHDLLYGVVLRGARPPLAIHMHEVQPGLIFTGDDFSVSAFPVYHRGPDCFGYLFEERARRPFLTELAQALEIPPGPWRRELVDGKPVTLPDGRVITPDQVLGPERPGTRLVHVGDAGRTDELEDVCQQADALVIEATYLEEEADMARQFAHMTARQAAQLAARAQISHLILTHISRRYRERDVVAEAKETFPQTNVARDFDQFQVRRGECILTRPKEKFTYESG